MHKNSDCFIELKTIFICDSIREATAATMFILTTQDKTFISYIKSQGLDTHYKAHIICITCGTESNL